MLSRRSVLGLLAVPVLRGQQSGPAMFGDADSYERFMGRWSRILAPLLIQFAEPGSPGRVLDVGSGTGALSFALARQFPDCRVAGIDPAKEYVAYASSKNPFGERVSFQTGDAQRLEFPNASFDSTLSLLVMNFIPKPKLAITEMRRVTKAGGRIAAAVWDYADGMRMLRFFWDAVNAVDPSAGAEHDESKMPLSHRGELGALWKEAGMERVEERPLTIDQKFVSFADYWDAFLQGQGPAGAYMRALGAQRLETLRAEVKRRLPLKAEDAPFALTARAWAVRGDVPR